MPVVILRCVVALVALANAAGAAAAKSPVIFRASPPVRPAATVVLERAP